MKAIYVTIIFSVLPLVLGCGTSSRISRANCDAASRILGFVIPLENDLYGAREYLENEMVLQCYQTPTSLEFRRGLESQGISWTQVSPENALAIAKEIGADFFVYGSVFVVDSPYIKPRETDDKWTFDDILAENIARVRAGTWVYATYYRHDVRTGRVRNLASSRKLFKL